MMLEEGMTITPVDIGILQSESVEMITLFTENIQYYAPLDQFEMYFEAYKERTNTILGTEPQKIIM